MNPIVHLILCIILLFLLLAFPGLAHKGADQGVELFFEALFPYLLPYLVLTQWLLRLTASFTKPLSKGKMYAQTYLISALGGFPTSATTVTFLKNSGQLNAKEASMLLAICHAPSPLFVIGFVGNDLLKATSFGWQILCIIHFINILFLAIYFVRHSDPVSTRIISQQKISASPFSDSLKESAPVLLLVGITIIFFTTIHTIFLAMLTTFIPNVSNYGQLFFTASLEMTNGLVMANNLFDNHAILPILLVSILAIQSLSIHLQILVIARTANISIKPYFLFRILSFVLIPSIYALLFFL